MRRILIALLLLVVPLAACGGDELTADEVLTASSEVMRSIETVSFALEREGEPFVIDPESDVSAVGAEGVYSAPTNVYAVVTVVVGGLALDAELIWNDAGVYLKLPPLQPDYADVSGGVGLDPSIIFDAQQGIPFILTDGLIDPTLVGDEDLDGFPTHHITAAADPEALSALLNNAVTFTDPTVDVYINRNTNEVMRVFITEADDESTWLIDFFGYGEPVDIPSP